MQSPRSDKKFIGHKLQYSMCYQRHFKKLYSFSQLFGILSLHHTSYVCALTRQCPLCNCPPQESQELYHVFISHNYLFSLTPSLLCSLFPKHTYQEADYLSSEAKKTGGQCRSHHSRMFLSSLFSTRVEHPYTK